LQSSYDASANDDWVDGGLRLRAMTAASEDGDFYGVA